MQNQPSFHIRKYQGDISFLLLNWPLKFMVLFSSAAHNSLSINGCDAVKFCADIYGPQTHTEFGDPVTLAPALRSQFLFGFKILTHFGRVAPKLGEDVRSTVGAERNCTDERLFKVYHEMQYLCISGTAAGFKRSIPVRRANSWKTLLNLEFIK